MGIGKLDLDVAKKLANDVIRHVAPAMQRVEAARSIRRGKSAVGAIELVGIPCQRGKLIKLLDDEIARINFALNNKVKFVKPLETPQMDLVF